MQGEGVGFSLKDFVQAAFDDFLPTGLDEAIANGIESLALTHSVWLPVNGRLQAGEATSFLDHDGADVGGAPGLHAE